MHDLSRSDATHARADNRKRAGPPGAWPYPRWQYDILAAASVVASVVGATAARAATGQIDNALVAGMILDIEKAIRDER